MLFCRLRLKLKKYISTKKQHNQEMQYKKHTQKNPKKQQQTNNTQKIIKKHMKKYNPKNLNVEKLYKNTSRGFRTRANITGSMTEVLHVTTALFFRLIKHVKSKQLKLVLDCTCYNMFTQQVGTITAITLKISNVFS